MTTMYWLILMIVLLVIEAFTMGLTTIWFAAGCLVALVMGMAGLGQGVQIVSFLIASIVLLILTRPIAVRYFNRQTHKTNVDELVGKQGLVLEEIDTIRSTGLVEVKGQQWSAKTENPEGFIERQKIVVIERIEGVKLVVKEKED